MPALNFLIDCQDSQSKARVGLIQTKHSAFETPVFMPVGTRGTVKTLTHQHLQELGAKIILGNTYHLMLRPGMDVIKAAGGLHSFINWKDSLLTDSGGYQVFSLSSLNKITEEGVHFQSHIDGAKCFLGPQESMEIQKILGSDIVMAFDECAPFPSTFEYAQSAWERTRRWAIHCRQYSLQSHQNLFGIVQGSVYPDLRVESAKVLTQMDFDGYAVGGLAVGEPAEQMNAILDITLPHLPITKPRYLMGVGTPRNIIEAVLRGIDMFDCVMPTRNARNGTAFTWQGKIHIKAGRYAQDFTTLDPELESYTSQFSKAYLRHLLNVDEITGLTLVSLHNVAFYLDLMKKIRQAIREGTLNDLYQKICSVYPI